MFICLRPRAPNLPPSDCIRVYSILIHDRERGVRGKGGELNQRERERGYRGEYRTQSWVENTNMSECTQDIGYLPPV
jgi:hypothetical protein